MRLGTAPAQVWVDYVLGKGFVVVPPAFFEPVPEELLHAFEGRT